MRRPAVSCQIAGRRGSGRGGLGAEPGHGRCRWTVRLPGRGRPARLGRQLPAGTPLVHRGGTPVAKMPSAVSTRPRATRHTGYSRDDRDCRGRADRGRWRRTTRGRTRGPGSRPTRRPPWPAAGAGPGSAAAPPGRGRGGGTAGMSAVSAARSAPVRAVSARPARVSSSSLVSRPCTNASFSASITCSRSAWPARSRSRPAAAGSCGPAITGTSPSAMRVSVARLLPRSHPAATPRSTAGCRSDRVFGRRGGIGAPGGGAPGQDAARSPPLPLSSPIEFRPALLQGGRAPYAGHGKRRASPADAGVRDHPPALGVDPGGSRPPTASGAERRPSRPPSRSGPPAG